tara:strand:+ start:5617 stop:6363 length:747 start_codon:yes stop_codon:yes gene_type:complete
MFEIRPRLKGNKAIAFNHLTKKQSRVLVIGDLHEPFCLDSYLDFCLEMKAKHLINRVVFIGDIIDNHYSSYHETDSEALGGKDELELAIKRIARWYRAFPKADVIIGNHDRMIMRKAQTSAIPKKWIKSYQEVLEVPNWNFTDRLVIDNVQYVHGEGGNARTRCKADMMNTIQGHWHTFAFTEYFVGANFKIFGCQTGCGIDFDSYAMAYAKRGKKPAISVAICIGGQLCFNELMNLGTNSNKSIEPI